jgi:hypothetical protein
VEASSSEMPITTVPIISVALYSRALESSITSSVAHRLSYTVRVLRHSLCSERRPCAKTMFAHSCVCNLVSRLNTMSDFDRIQYRRL